MVSAVMKTHGVTMRPSARRKRQRKRKGQTLNVNRKEQSVISFSEQMQRWTHVSDRALNRFEQISIARPFKYDHYWKRWTRIIKPVVSGFPYGILELNLTPIPNAFNSTFDSDV